MPHLLPDHPQSHCRTAPRFPVRLTFALAASALMAMGFSTACAQETAASPLVIMPLGDSITVGASVPKSIPGGYRGPLLKILTTSGLKVSFVGSDTRLASPELTASGNAAHDGHGSYPINLLTENLDALAAMPRSPSAPDSNNGGFWLTGTPSRPPLNPGLILVMAGTNDLGMFQRTPDAALANMDALLSKVAALRPKATVIVSTLLPYNGAARVKGRDYSQREARNLAFNAGLPAVVARRHAAGQRVYLYDMRKMVNPANAPQMLCSDGVHPTQAGYEAIAAGWAEAIRSLPKPAGSGH